jgi:hypothetical protein
MEFSLRVYLSDGYSKTLDGNSKVSGRSCGAFKVVSVAFFLLANRVSVCCNAV